jgi:hypothetical protein
LNTSPQPATGNSTQPLSPALATLLQALQQQVLAEARSDVPSEAVVLDSPAPGSCSYRFSRTGGSTFLKVHSAGYLDEDVRVPQLTVDLYRDHVPAPEHRGWAHPHIWYGDENRRDQFGRVWSCSLRMVIDDFGTLVPVEAVQ